MNLPIMTVIRVKFAEMFSERVRSKAKFSLLGSKCFVQQETIETRVSDFREALSFFDRVSIVPNRYTI